MLPKAITMIPKPSVFISYSHEDLTVERDLHRELSQLGVYVHDDQELAPADSLLPRIRQAIGKVDFFLSIVSVDSVKSKWCREELRIAQSEFASDGIRVIPLLLGEVPIPSSLDGLLYIKVDPTNLGAAALSILETEKRDLRDVLGFWSQGCDIILPARTHRTQDFFALAHVLIDGCARLDIHPETLISGERLTGEANRIVLAGWRHNSVMRRYMNDLPGFRVVRRRHGRGRRTEEYRCGDLPPLKDSDACTYGFLVKLTSKGLGPGVVHLVWGHRGMGTAAAAYYLTHHYRRLATTFGDRPYFVALEVPVNEGYRSVLPTFRDLTGCAQLGRVDK